MQLDGRSAFAYKLAATGQTANLGDSVDLQAAGFHGAGEPLYFNLAVSGVTGFSDALKFRLRHSDGIDSNGHLTTGSGDVPGVRLDHARASAAGMYFVMVPPLGELKRYLGVSLQVGGAGTAEVTAWVSNLRPPRYHTYSTSFSFSTNFDA